MIRPRIHVPLWAALAIPGAAYVIRSLALRGGDFRPDVPGDVVAGAALLVGITVVAWGRRALAADTEEPSRLDRTADTDEGSSEDN